MKKLICLCALLTVAAVGGCASTAESGSVPSWEPPDDYEFTLESSCGERLLIGQFRIVVGDGAVTDVEGLDGPGRRIEADADHREQVPTLQELLEQATTAEQEGADVVDVTTDPSRGHPSRIDIDWNINAVDDEACYQISGYAAHD